MNRLFNSLIVLTLAGVGMTSVLPKPSLAQVNSANPQEIFAPERNSDPFSSRNTDNSMGVFDLIHRAQLGSMRDPSEYATEQDQNINSAAAAFRERQRQLIQQPRQPQTPVNAVPAPTQPGN